ncbi:hypothetical protein E4S40_00260 [Algoriphagus kandeliae]|uniref:DUF3471 domain-containing protein n=1 Tax=Algoriphagus kandeliae TaxID=2562278 RepID=A0A4Y9R1T8_9BACT|nr:hypothetical protein [Algoriphagus kandeliae]TFV97125.1 hypothetical protein E4S40_00260 [Algoriphagus kandeliae]
MIKKFTLALLLGITGIFSAYSQEITANEVDIPLSPDAQKAAQKGMLFHGGSYWNDDMTQLYNFFLYEDKKNGLMFLEVTTDDSGEVISTAENPYNESNLSQFSNLAAEPMLTGSKVPENLAGKEFGYFQKTVLAGKPKLNIGKFENRYYNNLWAGFKFKKEDQIQLEDKFWPFVSFALQGEGVDNQNYQTRRMNRFLRALDGETDYIPLDGKAFIAGLMATSNPQYISGVYDMSSKTWDNQVTTNMESNPIGITYSQTPYGVLALVSQGTKDDSDLMAIRMDPQGNILKQIRLPFAEGPKKRPTVDVKIMDAGNAQFIIAPYYPEGLNKKPSIAIYKIEEDLVFAKQILNSDIEAKLNIPAGSKAKMKDLNVASVENILALSNGDYILSFANQQTPVSTVFLQLSSQGDLKSAYLTEEIEGDNNEPVRLIGKNPIHLPSELLEVNGMVYALIRSVPAELEQGIQASREDFGSVLRITTVRIDEVMAEAKIFKIDPQNQKISSSYDFNDQLIVGTIPYLVTPSGKLIFKTVDPKKGTRRQLILN